jgi:hypothetical protein
MLLIELIGCIGYDSPRLYMAAMGQSIGERWNEEARGVHGTESCGHNNIAELSGAGLCGGVEDAEFGAFDIRGVGVVGGKW